MQHHSKDVCINTTNKLFQASCDVGKTYCCYNSQRYGLHKLGQPGNFGSKFGPDDNAPAVLAGPNGPVDHLQPDFYKPPPVSQLLLNN